MTVPIWKVLGQLNPAVATPTRLYVVPVGRSTLVETLTVCNQDVAQAQFRISVRVNGAVADPSQFLYYDLTLLGNDTYVHNSPIRLFTADELWVESTTATVSFNAFGTEQFA